MDARYGKVRKGNSIPYGALVDADQTFRSAYYRYNLDEDLPELPMTPQGDTWYDPWQSIDERIDAQRLCELVRQNLRNKRYYPVLYMLDGLEMTLAETAAPFHVGRERIRQVNRRAQREAKRILIYLKKQELECKQNYLNNRPSAS